MTLSAPVDQAPSSNLIARFGATLRGHGERIELRIAEKNASPALRIALNAGAKVISSTPHRVSLESIFLSAVNDSKAEEATR